MEKIVPFKRDISFETKIAEIRSISLEHTYEIQNNLISGTFIISGNYKLTDTSTNVDPFKFEIPFDISIDSRYELNKATVDINDFFYELINNEVLSVSITLIIDNLEEKEEREMEEIQEEKQEVEEIKPVSRMRVPMTRGEGFGKIRRATKARMAAARAVASERQAKHSPAPT